MNNELRTKVRVLKAVQNITYKEMAALLEISIDSFYNWISGQYELGKEKTKRLNQIVDILMMQNDYPIIH